MFLRRTNSKTQWMILAQQLSAFLLGAINRLLNRHNTSSLSLGIKAPIQAPKRNSREYCQTSRRKISMPTMDGSLLLSPEFIEEVMRDLRQDWLITKCDDYRYELEHIWSPPNPPPLLNGRMPKLWSTQNYPKRGRETACVETWEEHLFYNQATVLYGRSQ